MRNVGYRIAATAALIFALIAISLGGAAFLVAHMSLSRTLDHSIEHATTQLVSTYRAHGRSALIAAVRERSTDDRDNLGYALFEKGGKRGEGLLAIDKPAAGWSDTHFFDPIEGQDPARILAVKLPGDELLVVGGDRRPIELANRAIIWLFGASVVAMLVLCMIMALILGRYLQDRLGLITQTSDAVIAGDLSRRIPLRGTDDEFDRIASSLNTMLDRIDSLVAGIRRVSTDVAHDLRTPLTRLRARVERDLTKHPEPSPHRAALEHSIEQVDEVLAIFSAMLRVAELEGNTAGPLCEAISLSELLSEVHQSFEPAFADEGRTLKLVVEPGVVVSGDRSLLMVAAFNLLENVLSHTPRGTGATIEARQAAGSVNLAIRDDGPGVDQAALPHLFERRFRANPASTANGNGLGLSQVAAIARAHDGVVDAQNLPGGFEVSITFPPTPAASTRGDR